MIRRMAAGLVLLLAGGSLAGCAGSRHAPASSATVASAPSKSREVGRTLTKAEAVALANAVNLRAADVPGFRVSPKEAKAPETAAEKRLERQALKCLGSLGSVGGSALAEVGSKNFKLERGIVNLSVRSEVTVAPTTALANKQRAGLHSARARACLSHYLDLLFRGKALHGATISPVKVLSGTPPAPGATGSFGLRITATFTVQRIPIPFYFDILGFTYGPAQVTLLSSGLPEPFPAKAQEQLFSVLLARAQEHSRS